MFGMIPQNLMTTLMIQKLILNLVEMYLKMHLKVKKKKFPKYVIIVIKREAVAL